MASLYRGYSGPVAAGECDGSGPAAALSAIFPSTTTGNSLNEWRRLFGLDHAKPIYTIENFYRHELYLDSLLEKIEEALRRFPDPEDAELVFSAHSVPQSIIARGDPYQEQIEATVELLMQRGGWSQSPSPLLSE